MSLIQDNSIYIKGPVISKTFNIYPTAYSSSDVKIRQIFMEIVTTTIVKYIQQFLLSLL